MDVVWAWRVVYSGNGVVYNGDGVVYSGDRGVMGRNWSEEASLFSGELAYL